MSDFSNEATRTAYVITQNYEDLYFGIKEIIESKKQENTRIRELCKGRVTDTYHIKWKEIVNRYKEEFLEE